MATLAYARLWQDQLDQDSVLIKCDGQTPWIVDRPAAGYAERLNILRYTHPSELPGVIAEAGLDALYVLTAGQAESRFAQLAIPLWVHAVFPSRISDIHGNRYACVSDWLAKEAFNGKIPAVPHIVDHTLSQEDGPAWRQLHGIPADAILIGSMGGSHTFDLAIARFGLQEALQRSNRLFFAALNHQPFIQHERALFLAGTDDRLAKATFIQACDAMLHGRTQGETFGLACAEFTAAGKPVLAWRHAPERHHLEHFCPPSLQYSTAGELCRKLLTLDPAAWSGTNLQIRCQPFRAEAVAPTFQTVFASGGCPSEPPHFGRIDKTLIFKRRLQRSLRARLSRRHQQPVDPTQIKFDPVSGFPMEE
ncbi:glycosyltransferase [Synechococcus sp. HJ21-Hayes]|uniref:glycosyltransferase n=1 Tax=unclassified Synechococcus TaxID=2626047 RepID=UPI0020CCDF9C|nr:MULTISPECIES: glycosyltransferase [unclassified Synechococcus]MCP9830272.1 glycosyltransferase [Synechococcus sp. JJ3a-Johnson]MCP9853003.1 glycosyltransferase [Synechococcus sp. HJ21-Hayes]